MLKLKIILLFFTLLYNICIYAIPISSSISSSKLSLSSSFKLSSTELLLDTSLYSITTKLHPQQKIKFIDNLTSLITYHLTFDHIDRIIYQLSQHTANILQSSMKIEWDESKNDTITPIDMTILIDQLQGGIVSFIEDRLPTIWNQHLNLDLNIYIRQQLLKCSQSSSLTSSYYFCLEQENINQYLHEQLQVTWEQIVNQDLPTLLQTVHKQVNGILSQLLNNENHQLFNLTWQLNHDQLKQLDYQPYYNDDQHHHPTLYTSMLQTVLSTS
ncbi:unnamed protein product [Cunninghamella blakesleeana]